MLLLLLSYHKRLRMLSEVLELRVEGGKVSHSWCMRVVSHGYGRQGGKRGEGGGSHACGTKPGGGRISEDA